MNPFRYGSTVVDEAFCSRPELEKTVAKHIASNQNIHMEGERRTGKTSLIIHVAGSLKKRMLLHFDLMLVKSVEDVCGRLVDGLSKAALSVGTFEKVIKSLAHLRPTVSVNPSTGEPSLSLAATGDASLAGKSVVELLEFAHTSFAGKKPIIFLDEFQDLLKIADAQQVLALLRSSIQNHHGCAYIYSGSSRSDMDSIFRDPDSPFFKSAIPVPVGGIDRSTFIPFLVKKFRTGKRRASKGVVSEILDLVSDNPGDAQELCNCLWEVTDAGDDLLSDSVEKALTAIFSRELRYFEQVIDSLTPFQKRCLHAIAVLDGLGIYSKRFFELTGSANSGSITRVIGSLQKNRVIYSRGKQLVFASPFLKLWLLRNPHV